MKTFLKTLKEINIKKVRIEAAITHGDDEIPYDFPLRKGDMWIATIDIDEGKILNWTGGKEHLFIKVCDMGSYYLLDENDNEVIIKEEDYVPNDLIPGEYGDYIDLYINETGTITNWYSQPSLDDFQDFDDE
ncbi:hypothetical protein M0Q97_02515 [Candidatus Dojkabacteria bacterium]|jgi:hypothetical protein|nr:hypothetical protein [Candidatus Dojkabacteria bacterium]